MAVIGVVGAGIMGTGVAQAAAQSGHQVVLTDLDAQTLDRARRTIEHNCRMSRLLGGPAVDTEAVLDAIEFSSDLKALEPAGIVVENITEKWDLKRELYPRIDAVCDPECVFIANTSAIPITRIASATSRPDRVVGVHFMNPVPLKNVVELIPGHHTSEETLRRTREFLDSMGKVPVQVRDASGFVSNRVLMLTINEAAFLVHEGVATAQAVDEVFRGCFDHPMGPLETADLIGVDTILLSIEVLHDSFGDSKYRPCPLLKEMTDAGLHGRKTGQGFYSYATPTPVGA
ncbi:3-hydroxyacyl-CoA dehydrogenase family protein [Streptomyces sp. NBC_01716]|uniref:3-hydroxyacyl-CoA dehydrogenase family protein n=1 Tax=Streptomyces sp. NBC_01716 TaxID=2975917 RepID=UPI003FCC97E7